MTWCTSTSQSSGASQTAAAGVHGVDTTAKKITGKSRPGYAHLHHAIDDHSRLAYSEELPDETTETAAQFWTRANTNFESVSIKFKRVLTDNGSCYRSQLFAAALGENITHQRTRPYRPQTNGKVERFNRTLLEEWAYAHQYTSNAERAASYADCLHSYNHHRGHTSLKGQTPADRVTNLSGTNTKKPRQATENAAQTIMAPVPGDHAGTLATSPKRKAPARWAASGKAAGSAA